MFHLSLARSVSSVAVVCFLLGGVRPGTSPDFRHIRAVGPDTGGPPSRRSRRRNCAKSSSGCARSSSRSAMPTAHAWRRSKRVCSQQPDDPATPAPPATAPTAATAAPTGQTPAPEAAVPAGAAGAGGPAGSLPVYGNASGAVEDLQSRHRGHRQLRRRGRHERDRIRSPRCSMNEAEVSFQAVVDPYARADFFLAALAGGTRDRGRLPDVPDAAGRPADEGRQDEGAVRQGQHAARAHAAVGRRPLSMPEPARRGRGAQRLRRFGVEADSQSGPLPRGDRRDLPGTDTLFQQRQAQRPELRRPAARLSRRDRSRRTSTSARRSPTGHNDAGADFDDAASRPRRDVPLPAAAARDLPAVHRAHRALLEPPRCSRSATPQAFGTYVSGDYQFARRWFAGGRYDLSERADDASLARQRAVAAADLLAERVQPDPRAVPPHALRRGGHGERGAVPVPVLDRCARRARVLDPEVAMITQIFSSPRSLLRGALVRPPRLAAAHSTSSPTTERPGVARRAKSAATRSRSTSLAQGLPGSALRRGEAQLRPASSTRRICWSLVGRDLEIGWLPPLITQSRNAKIQPGGRRLPRRVADRQDPRHADRADHARDGRRAPARQPALLARPGERRAASPRRSRERLSQLDPANAAYYAQRAADFDRRLAEAQKRWKAAMAPYKGVKVVTYHRSWTNFADAFGLDVIGYVEPKPGIPPTPRAHARRDQRDEGAERQDHHGRAVLRLRRRRTRSPRRPARKVLVHAAVGRRCAAGGRLLQAVRLRRQPAGRRDQSRPGPDSRWT